MGPSFFDDNGLRWADRVAGLTLGAVILVNEELIPHFDHGVKSASGLAHAAEDAVLGQDAEGPESLASLGPAELVMHVLFVLFTEIFDGRKYRVRRTIAETAERSGHDHLAHLFEMLDVAIFPTSGRDFVQKLVHLPGTDTAGRALAAGLALSKREGVLGHIHHAVVFVEDHHASGAHNRAHRR